MTLIELSPLSLWPLFVFFLFSEDFLLFISLVVVDLHCKYCDEGPSSEHDLFNNLFPIY